MIIELIAEDQYDVAGPQAGDQGVVVQSHKNEDGEFYSVYFTGFVGIFFVWKNQVKVISK